MNQQVPNEDSEPLIQQTFIGLGSSNSIIPIATVVPSTSRRQDNLLVSPYEVRVTPLSSKGPLDRAQSFDTGNSSPRYDSKRLNDKIASANLFDGKSILQRDRFAPMLFYSKLFEINYY
jgi:hypothetical protein